MLHRVRFFCLFFLILPLLSFFSSSAAPSMEGVVVDSKGAVPSASIRWQGQCEATLADRAGRFSISARKGTSRLTATAPDHRIGWTAFENNPLTIHLDFLPAEDNLEYAWIDPTPSERLRRPQNGEPLKRTRDNCGNCHGKIHDEWAESAHSRSAVNPRVLALFGGDESPLGKEWNLLEQHPFGAGVCAGCHAPTMKSPQLDYDLRKAGDSSRADLSPKGVHCDYCHKIAEAPVDKIGTRFGRDGYPLLRPRGGEQFFFGPLPDAVRPGESFAHAPFSKESRYCASCHEGVIFGVHVYGTYSEWLASPHAKQGVQCQDCHMAPTGKMTNIAPGHGGIERDPKTLASHDFPGGTEAMLKKCLTLKVVTRLDGETTRVAVHLSAAHVGHRVPTGFIDRHLMLLVEAKDTEGKNSAPLNGPILPDWAGQELAGKAGVLYAKVLADEHGRAPLPFWLAHEKMTDTRLHPGQTDHQVFIFPKGASIRVRLYYRRLWPVVSGRIPQSDNEVLLFDWKE